jgi:hypothetical protein
MRAIVEANVRDGVLLPEEATRTIEEANGLKFSCGN